MRSYFFGDLHGNVSALERCLAHIHEVEPDRVYCLGDLVGWLPFGHRTLERMRALGVPTVAGNHDLLVAGLFTDFPDQLDRIQASAYNAGLLAGSPGAAEYLLGLPLALEEDEFIVVHHSPFDLPQAGQAPGIDCFHYLDAKSLEAAREAWRRFPKRLIVSGHDHLPALYALSDDPGKAVRAVRPEGVESVTIELERDCRYWVKAGSVGGPYRDQVPVVNSVLFDGDRRTITLFRLPYPLESLVRELRSQRFCLNIPTIGRYVELVERFAAGQGR
jgi:predicted phosphodiesterase